MVHIRIREVRRVGFDGITWMGSSGLVSLSFCKVVRGDGDVSVRHVGFIYAVRVWVVNVRSRVWFRDLLP